MRRLLRTYLLMTMALLGAALARAQVPMTGQGGTMRDQYGNQIDPALQPDNLEDSTVNIQSLPPKLYMWRVDETLGERILIPADTASLNFQNTNLGEGMEGHYNHLGNLGAPRLSRIFLERRTDDQPTIFIAPFSSFYVRPDQLLFTNSNVPYTNLTYYKAGNKVNGEDRFKSYFSVNVNKRLAVGFNIDYLYGRGYYANQSTSHFNAGVFASYIGNKYQMHAAYHNNFLKMNENGGITDDRYITRPEEVDDVGGSQYIPTRLQPQPQLLPLPDAPLPPGLPPRGDPRGGDARPRRPQESATGQHGHPRGHHRRGRVRARHQLHPYVPGGTLAPPLPGGRRTHGRGGTV